MDSDRQRPLTDVMEELATDEDRRLLALAAGGDSAAAGELLDQTGAIVYGFIYARVGGNEQAAEDLIQATYLEAVRSAATFRGEAALSTWLCTIARRQLAGYFKQENRQRSIERKLRLVDDPQRDASSVPDGSMADDSVIEALGRVPDPQRQVLVMKYLDGLHVKEIAKELGRSNIQIQSLLQRGRSSLRRELGKQTDE